MTKFRSLTIYQPYSWKKITTIKNPSVVRFMLSMMFTPKDAETLMKHAPKDKGIYLNAKQFSEHARHFVYFMNYKYYLHNGHYALRLAEIPNNRKNNPFNNGKWVRQNLTKIQRTAKRKNVYLRGVQGLTQLQLKRVFRILKDLESINNFESPRFYF